MLGGVMTARTTKLHDDKRAADVSAMTESVLGVSGLSAEAKRYQAIMDNEAAPAYLRDIARRKFQAEIAPPQGSGGGSRRSGSGGGNTTAAAPASGGRLVGEYWINGVLHGRNSSGQMIPYKGPDGAPVTQDAPAGATPPPVAAANPDDPLNIMPSDPLGLR